MTKLRIGTRGSALALKQAEIIKSELKKAFPLLQTELVILKTKGDKITDRPLYAIGGKGLFITEFEDALKNNEIDIAVHSGKDLPSETHLPFIIAAVLERGDGIKLKYTYCYFPRTGNMACLNPDTPPSIGKFKLVEIAGDMRYDCSKIATDFISNYAYGVPQTYQMYSHSTIPSFELYLGESQNGFTSYKVYFPTAAGTQLTCTQTSQKLSCQSATITGEARIFLFWYCQETQKYETPLSHIIQVGANIDAIEVAGRFGIGADRAINYECDREGTALNYKVLSETVSAVRRSKSRVEMDEAVFACCAPIREDYKRRHKSRRA